MALFLASVLVLGMVAAFVAPLYYCKESVKNVDDRNASQERQINVGNESCKSSSSPEVQIKIKRPRSVNVVSPRLLETSLNHDRTELEGISKPSRKQNALQGSSEEDSGKAESLKSHNRDKTATTSTRINPATRRRRFFENLLRGRKSPCVSGSAMFTNDDTLLERSCQSCISEQTVKGNASVSSCENEIAGTKKLVTAQIEVRPKHCTSSTIEPEEATEQSKSMTSGISSSRKSTPLTKILLGKLKNFKATLPPPGLGRESSYERITDESQRTNVACKSPVGHSTILLRRQSSEKGINPSRTMLTTRESQRFYRNTVSGNEPPGSAQNSSSRIKVIGLRMSQAEVVDLTQLNQEENLAVFASEEESIISIAFHKNTHGEVDVGDVNDSKGRSRLTRSSTGLPGKPGSLSLNFFRALNRSRARSFGETKTERDSGISHAVSDGTTYANFPQFPEKPATVETHSNKFWNRIYSRRNTVYPVA